MKSIINQLLSVVSFVTIAMVTLFVFEPESFWGIVSFVSQILGV